MANIRFDTKVQFIKYKVLSEVARRAYNEDLNENLLTIPKVISPGPDSVLRCCVYKERAAYSALDSYGIVCKYICGNKVYNRN